MAFAAWTILCSGTVIDKDTGRLSVFNMLDNLEVVGQSEAEETPDRVIALKTSYKTVTSWHRSDSNLPEEAFCRIRLILPNGSHVEKHEIIDEKMKIQYTYKVDLTEERGTIIETLSDDLPYFGPGTYYHIVEVYSDGMWQECSRTPIYFSFVVAT